MTPKIGVILFPGINCEIETMRALERSQMKGEIILWNDESVDYSTYDGFAIPGGFSYEDRGRSGIISSKNPLLNKIREEANKGKPVIGICNGAQVVVESKLIPGLDENHVEMALAFNKMIDKEGKIIGTGFLNDWIYIKTNVTSGRCAFNNFSNDHIMRIPIAHGEGRFMTQDKGLLETLKSNEQTAFQYCDENGEIINQYPINPNGAALNLAGVCNPEGNVMALMPHPERTLAGQAIFDSMRDYIGKTFEIKKPEGFVAERKLEFNETVETLPAQTLEILVDTIITDNEERTLEYAIHKMGHQNMKLKKKGYYLIETHADIDLKEIAKKLIESGELVNLAKEVPEIVINQNEIYSYDKDTNDLKPEDNPSNNVVSYITFDKENSVGKNILQTLQGHFDIDGLKNIKYGKKWDLSKAENDADQIVGSHIFHNPHSMEIFKV